MLKEYYKLKDINEDIWAYEAKLRSLQVGTYEHRIVKKYLLGLKLRKKRLNKKNAGNPEFFHKGIPPLKASPSRKQLKLNALDKAIKETKSRHEMELSELYKEKEKVKKS